MLRRKQRTLTINKTNSIATQQTVQSSVEMSINLGTLTNKFLYNAQEELNITKICSSQRKFNLNAGLFTQRKALKHHEQVKNLTIKLQRNNCEQNPFLRAKLRHMVKDQGKYEEQRSQFFIQEQQKWLQQPKFITLRQKNRQNMKKQNEASKYYRNSISFY